MRRYDMARPGWETARRAQLRKAVLELAALALFAAGGLALYLYTWASQ